MLVKYLNTNQPSVLFLLPVFGALVWIPFFINPVTTDSHIVTSYVMVFKRDLLLDGHAGAATAFCISLLTAIFFNRIVNNSDLCNKPSFIYAFTYVLLEASLRTNPGFYSWQLSQLFILAALWPLLKIYNQRQVIDLGFEVGLLLALASFLFEPSLVFFLVVPVFLQVFRPFNWREWLFPIIGFGLVFLFYACYRLLKGEPFFMLFMMQPYDFYKVYNAQPAVLIICGIVVVFGIFSYMAGARKVVMHARKQRQVIVFMFLITTGAISFLNYSMLACCDYFIILSPAALFAGYYFGNNRFKWLTELVFIGLAALHIAKFNI